MLQELWIRNPNHELLHGLAEWHTNENYQNQNIETTTQAFPFVIILCHGLTSDKHSFVFNKLSPIFARNFTDCIIFRFDFSGNGKSEGTFRYANYFKEVSDLQSVIQYFESKLQKQVIGLVGHSKGSNIVLLHQYQYSHAKFVINNCGRFFMQRDLLKRFDTEQLSLLEKEGKFVWMEQDGKKLFVTKEDLEERKQIIMKQIVETWQPKEECFILTIHGTDDTTIPVEDAQLLDNAIKEKNNSLIHHEVYIVKGAGHSFTGFEVKIMDRMKQFIQKVRKEHPFFLEQEEVDESNLFG